MSERLGKCKDNMMVFDFEKIGKRFIRPIISVNDTTSRAEPVFTRSIELMSMIASITFVNSDTKDRCSTI